jgi:hypothetical protein
MCLVDVVIQQAILSLFNFKILANEIDMFGSLSSFGSNKTIWFGKRLVDITAKCT